MPQLTTKTKQKIKTSLVLRSPIYTKVLSLTFNELSDFCHSTSQASLNEADINQIADISVDDFSVYDDISFDDLDELEQIVLEVLEPYLNKDYSVSEPLSYIRESELPFIKHYLFRRTTNNIALATGVFMGGYSFLERVSNKLKSIGVENKTRTIALLLLSEMEKPSKNFGELLKALNSLPEQQRKIVAGIFTNFTSVNDSDKDTKAPKAEVLWRADNVFLTQPAKDLLSSISSAEIKLKHPHLCSAVEHRFQTLIKITKMILDFQSPLNLPNLKPITQAEVAAQTGLSESTISRVMSSAAVFVQNYNKSFYLNKFCEYAVSSLPDGKPFTQTELENEISDLVKNEKDFNVLADAQIGQKINHKYNLKLSRRLITKYRNKLKIYPSNIRKRVFQIRAALNL